MRIKKYDLYGTSVEIPIPDSYKDCITLIKSDEYRLKGKVESTLRIVLRNLKPFSRSWLFWLRLCQYKGWLYPIFRVIYECISRKYQIQIQPKTKIGYGLYVGHKICIVINSGTIIGNNVNISQFLNIGTNHNTPAIIGDNVYLGPSVNIVEDVKIGCNSTIGANAVVVKDIPENATAAGVPAKVLNYNNPAQYIGNPYHEENRKC